MSRPGSGFPQTVRVYLVVMPARGTTGLAGEGTIVRRETAQGLVHQGDARRTRASGHRYPIRAGGASENVVTAVPLRAREEPEARAVRFAPVVGIRAIRAAAFVPALG